MVSMMVSYDDYLRHLTVMVIVVVIGVGYGVPGINKYREIGNGSAVKWNQECSELNLVRTNLYSTSEDCIMRVVKYFTVSQTPSNYHLFHRAQHISF